MSERGRVLVINPNSNQMVTAALDAALNPFRFADGPEIKCMTLEEGPYGIESQEDVESVTLPLRRLIDITENADAFVIGCYSDPGLHVCREGTTRPVFGIAESAVATALARGDRFGVIAVASRSIPRHMRYLRQMCLTDRFAGERALEMSVAEIASSAKTLDRLIEVGSGLKEENGADVIILGCAGMARYRAAVEKALRIPVIDPTQAAVALAIGVVRADWARSDGGSEFNAN